MLSYSANFVEYWLELHKLVDLVDAPSPSLLWIQFSPDFVLIAQKWMSLILSRSLSSYLINQQLLASDHF